MSAEDVREDDGEPGVLDRFFGNARLRRVGLFLSLGLLLLLPLGAMLAARMRPTTPATKEAPAFIERPRDPVQRAAYDRELEGLQEEGQRLKAQGVSPAELARRLDPRLRALNARFKGR